MAQVNAHHALVFQVQQKILNKHCIAYRHSHQNPASSMLAETIKRKLAIREAIWNEALDCFVDAAGETERLVKANFNERVERGVAL